MMKWLVPIAAVVFLSATPIRDATGAEIYTIDGQPVLLYKIVNWWYDSLPEESSRFCGRRIRCKNTGNAVVEYNEMKKEMRVWVRGGFAELLHYDPEVLTCQRLDREIFGDKDRNDCHAECSEANTIVFFDVEKHQYQKMKHYEKELAIVLEGNIAGLAVGRIALCQAGELLRHCTRKSNDGAASPYSLRLLIGRLNPGKMLAEFSSAEK